MYQFSVNRLRTTEYTLRPLLKNPIKDQLRYAVYFPIFQRVSILYTVDSYNISESAYTVYIAITYFSLFSLEKKLHGLSPRANYTDRATSAFRRS
jgi:hypothetical protein